MEQSPHPLGADMRAAYLDRLGVAAASPSVEMLFAIVRRQAERVPYETFWIAAGQRWSTDARAAARRIALDGRGGYCYHVNGALALLLRSLGFMVYRHVGGVVAHDPAPDPAGNHLVLTVSGLPSDDNPSGTWYVDHGLGDALHEPLPLEPGTYRQGPFVLTLDRTEHGFRLVHDPAGGFRSMSWSSATSGPADDAVLDAKHAWLSTSPDSGFVQVPMAETRDATGVDTVRGLVRSRRGDGAFTADPVEDRASWFALLADDFDLRFDDLDGAARDRLWATVLDSHRAWEARTRT